MTSTQEHHEDWRLRRKSAAFRLKHDVGKALRWSAPEERETEMEGLRARLAADLVGRASGGGANRDALQSFFEWRRENGPMFPADDPDLQGLERAMAILERLVPRLRLLEESSLLSLDEACLEASRACTAFYRRVALDDGPEILRPLGARR
jgi:hypothetical protein